MKKKIYYDIRDDINAYPTVWCYLIWSKRGPGKTYSTLRMVTEDRKKFIFMKRTNEDVKILCSGSGRLGSKMADYGVDLSPFKPLNRDFGWNIRPFMISEGLAGFWHCEDDERVPIGDPIGYCLSINSIPKYKGFDLSECDYIIFDEFIPKIYERLTNRNEGDSLMDFYETVSRDREKRGRDPLKLICLANATAVNNPVFNVLAVTDQAAEMDMQDKEYLYIEERGILMHCINSNFDTDEAEELSGIRKAMEGTQWAEMAYGGHFAYNDFTCIGRISLKGYTPVCSVKYKKEMWYLYIKEGRYYYCRSRHNGGPYYNLNRENDQKRYWQEIGFDLRQECIDDKVLFDKYMMYDLTVNYKTFFKL